MTAAVKDKAEISRLRAHEVNGIPFTIATLCDFGKLRIDWKRTHAEETNYHATTHEVNDKDFQKIMSMSYIEYQKQHGLELMLERDLRVRILLGNKVCKFYHISALKVCDIADKKVQFYWMPTNNEEPRGYYTNGTSPIYEHKYKSFANIFADDLASNAEDEKRKTCNEMFCVVHLLLCLAISVALVLLCLCSM